ncbi:MAG: hypothetical protein IKR74_00795 [Bacilli bacterium]|nr:hypothetical protein [Bacilli bacterium]
MKIITDFDFIDSVKNVNEGLHPLKVIRNNKQRYIHLLPIYTIIALMVQKFSDIDVKEIIAFILRTYGIYISYEMLFDIIIKNFNPDKIDIYAAKAITNLKKLVVMLEEINVSTTYNMLLESELYAKEHSFDTEDRIIPAMVSKKYIYVPSYGYDGSEKTTSILQEHTIGTKVYILSQDEPDKQYRRVLSKSHI